MNYDYAKIEAKWHKYWQEHNTFYTDVWDFSKPKYYVLDMSRIPPASACTRAIPRATRRRISSPA